MIDRIDLKPIHAIPDEGVDIPLGLLFMSLGCIPEGVDGRNDPYTGSLEFEYVSRQKLSGQAEPESMGKFNPIALPDCLEFISGDREAGVLKMTARARVPCDA